MSGPVLVGDIGGTNVRFAIAERGGDGAIRVEAVWKRPNDDFPAFEAALKTYFEETGSDRPQAALFAPAGPPVDGVVELTNRDWTISAASLKANFGFEDVTLVNDFAAMARAVPELPEAAFTLLKPGPGMAGEPVLVAGPGTGFGVATLLPQPETGWHVITGQGGHAAYAPVTDREHALLRQLQAAHGYVSKELVLSGSGLEEVHRALCELDGVAYEPLEPAAIMERAKAGDRICRDICEIRAAGTLAAVGDAALINGTRAGVVVTGGVAERLVEYLLHPAAIQRFVDRGPMESYMTPIPIRLLTHAEAPLIGAAALHYDRKAMP